MALWQCILQSLRRAAVSARTKVNSTSSIQPMPRCVCIVPEVTSKGEHYSPHLVNEKEIMIGHRHKRTNGGASVRQPKIILDRCSEISDREHTANRNCVNWL